MITDLVFFPGEITRFVWVLLVFLVVALAGGALWVVWGFILELLAVRLVNGVDSTDERICQIGRTPKQPSKNPTGAE